MMLATPRATEIAGLGRVVDRPDADAQAAGEVAREVAWARLRALEVDGLHERGARGLLDGVGPAVLGRVHEQRARDGGREHRDHRQEARVEGREEDVGVHRLHDARGLAREGEAVGHVVLHLDVDPDAVIARPVEDLGERGDLGAQRRKGLTRRIVQHDDLPFVGADVELDGPRPLRARLLEGGERVLARPARTPSAPVADDQGREAKDAAGHCAGPSAWSVATSVAVSTRL